MPIKTHNTSDPQGPLLGRTKVFKGGAFDSLLPDIYPHRRIHLAPWATMGEVRFALDKAPVDVLEGSVGFRLVRTAPYSKSKASQSLDKKSESIGFMSQVCKPECHGQMVGLKSSYIHALCKWTGD